MSCDPGCRCHTDDGAITVRDAYTGKDQKMRFVDAIFPGGKPHQPSYRKRYTYIAPWDTLPGDWIIVPVHKAHAIEVRAVQVVAHIREPRAPHEYVHAYSVVRKDQLRRQVTEYRPAPPVRGATRTDWNKDAHPADDPPF